MIMMSKISNDSFLIELRHVTCYVCCLLSHTHTPTIFTESAWWIGFFVESKRKTRKKKEKTTGSVERAIQYDHMRLHSAFIVFNANLTIFTIHKSDYKELRAHFNQIYFHFVFTFKLFFFFFLLSFRVFISHNNFTLDTNKWNLYHFSSKRDTFPRPNLHRLEQISLCECNSFQWLGLAVCSWHELMVVNIFFPLLLPFIRV